MAIPNSELFEAFLSGTKLVQIKSDEPSVAFRARQESISEAPVLYLSYPEMELKLDSVVKRIASELNATGGIADSDIALATLGIIVETREPGTPSTVHANRCLSSIHSAQLHQFVVLPNKPDHDYQIRIGEFSLKAFDPKKLLYWAQRGGCGYPIDLHRLTGHFALQRTPVDTKLINWEELPGFAQMMAKWGKGIATASIMDIYYQAVAWHYFQQIPALVKDHLLVLEGGALVHFDIDSYLSSILAYYIGLFHWKRSVGHRCWALLNRQNVANMNFCPPSLFSACEKWLSDEFGFHTLSAGKPLDSAIVSYCRFLQRAQTHRLQGRLDEAFLHFVIALDLLLGLEGRSSDSVCLRAAILVHRQMERPFDTQVSQLKRFYERRSKYVHEGRRASENDLLGIEQICTEVLWDLLATSASCRFNDIDAWLKQIDFIASAIRASREIPDTEFQSVGIPTMGRKRIPPNRISGWTTSVR